MISSELNVRESGSIVIIGAPRSGTNMLRDLICSIDGFETWPCDEINYIWRHRNTRFDSDVFNPELATPEVRRYIRGQFSKIQRRYGARTIVEKTCANSLRVRFVEAVLDRPRFVFIYRDGHDAIGSAIKRWKSSLDLAYVLKKAKFVPPLDLPYYASRYLFGRIRRLWHKEKRLPIWGPIVPELNSLAATGDLVDICAIQWKFCVELALDDLRKIATDRVLRISYESLVNKDVNVCGDLESFLAAPIGALRSSDFWQNIDTASIGKGRSQFSSEHIARLNKIIGPTMSRLGYK